VRRILVDGLSAKVGGGLTYLVSQLAAVERVRPDLDLRVLAAPWNEADLRAALRSPVLPVRLPNVAARFAWEQTVLPVVARPADLLYCPANFAPVGPQGAPTVLTVQNSNYFGEARHRDHNRGLGRRAKIALGAASVRRADAVVLISESLRAQVEADLGPVPGAVVLHSGAPTWPTTPSDQPLPAPDGSYVLSLANDYPHKRLDALVAAWAAQVDGASHPLVLAGDVLHERRQVLRATAGGAQAHLVFTGAISDRSHLRDVVAGARTMISASVQEAFPLGPAEAGALGTPLVLTDLPSHREVADGHARFVPPNDDGALGRAMAAAVAEGGRAPWTWPISWDDHARALVDVWASVARGRS
jgi:glycosyltransferase involved in cell wall biosynthesis